MPEPLEFDFDVELLRRAVLHYKATGEIPDREDLLERDDVWFGNVMRMTQWWDYERSNGTMAGKATLKGVDFGLLGDGVPPPSNIDGEE